MVKTLPLMLNHQNYVKMQTTDYIEKLVSNHIRAQKAYHVPESEGFIKLDAMENPYVLAMELEHKWLEYLKSSDINRYPDPQGNIVKKALQKIWNTNQDMVLGNGSDELIQLLLMLIRAPERVVLSLHPSFVMYKIIAENLGMEYIGHTLDENFQINQDSIIQAIAIHQPAIIFIAYPNNPTGTLFSEQTIKTIIEKAPGLVIIDEAYYPFANQQSFLPFIENYPNLLVMRTVSKMGLAGIRLGALMGDKAWLEEVDKLRMPYNINTLTQKTMAFVAEYKHVFEQQAEIICQEREKMLTALNNIKGIIAYPSHANFILFKVADANAIFAQLKAQKILIKNLHNVLPNHLRVTIGTPDENVKFLTFFNTVYGQ